MTNQTEFKVGDYVVYIGGLSNIMTTNKIYLIHEISDLSFSFVLKRTINYIRVKTDSNYIGGWFPHEFRKATQKEIKVQKQDLLLRKIKGQL